MARSRWLSPILLLVFAPALVAQSSANWDGVKQLTAGTEIRVRLMDGRKLPGTFQSATDDALVIATGKSPETLSRPMITKVSSKGKGHRSRNALIGFAVGAGGGLVVGAIVDADTCRSSCSGGFKNLGKEGITPLGALIGAAVGALVPTGGWHEVYRIK